MSDYADELRGRTDRQLLTDLSGWREGTENYLLVERELRRRRERWPEIRSWAALAISVIALAVAILKP